MKSPWEKRKVKPRCLKSKRKGVFVYAELTKEPASEKGKFYRIRKAKSKRKGGGKT